MPVVNEAITHYWNLADTDGGPYTGLAATMSATLRYGSTMASADESVSIAEIGSSGIYTLTYTPTSEAVYHLFVEESTNFFEASWEDDVEETSSTGSLSNSYATVDDVESHAQVGSYSSSTHPTEAQVEGYLVNRSAEAYFVMSDVAGTLTPGPTGFTTAIDTSTDAGSALNRLLKHIVGIGAAIDALQAGGAGEEPGRSERVNELFGIHQALLPQLRMAVKSYIGKARMARTHVDDGIGQTLPSATDEVGLRFTGTEKW